MTDSISVSYNPKAVHPFFLYNPFDESYQYFNTQDDLDACARDLIAGYLTDGVWDPDVEDMVAGRLTHHMVRHVTALRPPDDQLDDDGADEDGRVWGTATEIAEYRLEPMPVLPVETFNNLQMLPSVDVPLVVKCADGKTYPAKRMGYLNSYDGTLVFIKYRRVGHLEVPEVVIPGVVGWRYP